MSSEKPNLDSPANVDAAKEVRTEFDGAYFAVPQETNLTSSIAYKKKVRRLVRRSAEEIYD